MPKKESAKDRAASKAEEAASAAARAQEDALWSDGAASGGGKKAAAEAKRAEELARKQERAALEEEEMASETNRLAAGKPQPKITQAQIKANFIIPKKKNKKPLQPEIEENVNHIARDEAARLEAQGIDAAHATGVDGAMALLKQLNTGKAEEVDAHPERRRKAAFKAYEEANIPRIRAENPSLKLSQIKEIIFKEWQKSPENPVNQDA